VNGCRCLAFVAPWQSSILNGRRAGLNL
jgi:hypothetical protein